MNDQILTGISIFKSFLIIKLIVRFPINSLVACIAMTSLTILLDKE